ncbi:MAG: GerAB/ArcD/ProY family transporter [Eubacteriales bacterium]
MQKKKGKIGVRGAFLMLLLIIYSPAVRLFPSQVSKIAGQAGWLCPVVAAIAFVYYIRQLNVLLNAYPGLSLLEIFEKITGKIISKGLAVCYLLYLFIINSFDLKYYGERLAATIYPNTDNRILMVIMIVLVAYTLKSGLVIISRMSEFFFWIIIVVFSVLTLLLLPNVTLDKLTPISYLDILPVMQGSLPLISIWSYLTYILFMSDNMVGFDKFKKQGYQSAGILFFSVTLLLVTSIGTIGSYILSNAYIPYLNSVEPIILLQSVSGLESVLVTTWILADYGLLAILLLSFLKILNYIFNIKDTSLYINILSITIYFGARLLASNIYELVEFSTKIGLYIILVLCFIIPILMSWIYMLKTKTKKMLVKAGKNN